MGEADQNEPEIDQLWFHILIFHTSGGPYKITVQVQNCMHISSFQLLLIYSIRFVYPFGALLANREQARKNNSWDL